MERWSRSPSRRPAFWLTESPQPLRGQKKAPGEPALSESQRQKDTKAIRNGAPETAARSSLRCCIPYRVKPVNKGLNSWFRVYILVASVKSGLIFRAAID